MTTILKKRLLYLVLILITIPLGVGSRDYADSLPGFIAVYAGDILAATCIFFGLRFLAIRAVLWKVALCSYIICISVETLQLYQGAWMIKIRETRWGGILLGHGFLWSDWILYAMGVVLGWIIGAMLERRSTFRNEGM